MLPVVLNYPGRIKDILVENVHKNIECLSQLGIYGSQFENVTNVRKN
jgi:hypothetical protein